MREAPEIVLLEYHSRLGSGRYEGTFSLGSGTIRMYGLGDSHSPKISFAWSSETEPAMITSSPGFQFTGVDTLLFALSCN